MRKYLIFIMLLLTVLACKSKQKPPTDGGGGGGGGYIKPPTIVSGDEEKILGILGDIVRDGDDNGWNTTEWPNLPILKGSDIGKITNDGFFVANYAEETWITFAINHDRNVHVGMEQGLDKLEEALALLADKDGKVIDKSWDPRKFVYNYDDEHGDDIRIAWLGRVLGRAYPGVEVEMRFKSYDDQYPNALKFLEGTNKTYSALRNYPDEEIRGNMPSEFYGGEDWVHAGNRWAPHEEPKDPSDPDQRRKIWDQAGLFAEWPGIVYFYKSTSPNLKADAVWLVPRGMRFGYTAGRESGFLSGMGTPGSKATPKDATLADKELGGKYYTGYNTSSPRGKTIFRRPLPPNANTQGGRIHEVRFLTTIVAYNIRMKPSENSKVVGLFEDEYNVQEVIFEFDANSFADITADKFPSNEIPIRQLAPATGSIDGSGYDTHKIPLLYFSPKP